MEETRAHIRHLLATIAYRTAKCLRDAPPGFADFAAGSGVRTPAEIVRHMTGTMHFSGGLLLGLPRREAEPLPWEQEVARLEAVLHELDDAVCQASAWHHDPLSAVQGPLSDALTHAGQLALLRRLAGAPIPGENFARAEIHAGGLSLR